MPFKEEAIKAANEMRVAEAKEWKPIAGFKAYDYENFEAAHNDLLKNGWQAAGQDGNLGHIYSKVTATQSYGLVDIYCRIVGNMTGGYTMTRVERKGAL